MLPGRSLTKGIVLLSHKLNTNINKRDHLMKLFIETDITRIFHDNGLTLFKWKNDRLKRLE